MRHAATRPTHAGSRPVSFPESDGSITVPSCRVHLAASAARRAALMAGSRKSRAKR